MDNKDKQLNAENKEQQPKNTDIPSFDKEDEERWEKEIIRDWEQAIRDCKDM